MSDYTEKMIDIINATTTHMNRLNLLVDKNGIGITSLMTSLMPYAYDKDVVDSYNRMVENYKELMESVSDLITDWKNKDEVIVEILREQP
jgi:hypothetical protein